MIDPSVVISLAEMSRIELAPEELDRIAAQLTDILEQIAVLGTVIDPVTVSEPSSMEALRADTVGADEMHGTLGRFAPELREGFFTVPLLSTHTPPLSTHTPSLAPHAPPPQSPT